MICDNSVIWFEFLTVTSAPVLSFFRFRIFFSYLYLVVLGYRLDCNYFTVISMENLTAALLSYSLK